MRRHLATLLTALVLALIAWPSTASAQDGYTVALYTPSLDFADGVERNDYVSQVAGALSDATGQPWSGKAFARRSDFESELKSGALHVVIVDGAYFGARGSGLDPVASLKTSTGATSRVMQLVVGDSARFGSLTALRGARLSVAGGGGKSGAFVAGDLLGGEVKANAFFGSVDEAKDVRAAINAVELGKADAALVFSGYGKGLSDVATSTPAPLPVVALTGKLPTDVAAGARRTLRSLSVSGAGLVTGSTAYDSGAIATYETTTRRARDRWQPTAAEPSRMLLELGSLDIPDRDAELVTPPVSDALVVPSIESIQ